MNDARVGYWKRLWAALLGRDMAPPAPEAAPADEQLVAVRAKAAATEMDVRERDERIEAMRREYEALKADRDRGVRDAGRDEVERMLKKLTGPLSNLMALTELAEAGRPGRRPGESGAGSGEGTWPRRPGTDRHDGPGRAVRRGPAPADERRGGVGRHPGRRAHAGLPVGREGALEGDGQRRRGWTWAAWRLTSERATRLSPV